QSPVTASSGLRPGGTITMTLKTSIQLTLTALVAVAVAAPAFGAGEPKNQPPFARQATAHSSAPRAISGMTAIVALGEAKNEAPFTARYNADPGYSSAVREAAALMPVRTLQFFVLGDGA